MLCHDFNLSLFHYVSLNNFTYFTVDVNFFVGCPICIHLFTCSFNIYLLSILFIPSSF